MNSKSNFNLNELMEKINTQYFGFEELPKIRWSQGRIQKRYRRLTLGSYDPVKNEIRLHPLFREGYLPDFVRDYVLYHEMLHFENRRDLMRRIPRYKRRRIHTPDFHRREKEFPRADEARKLIREKMKSGF